MTSDITERRTGVRFEADEKPPILLAIGLGLQIALLTIGGIILTVAIVSRAGGAGEAYLSWAVFAAVAVSGATTILQAVRIGRIGAGYVLMMGTSGTFIAVCITAIAQGGPAMMATLIIISSLFQFVLSSRLSLLRRILTPAVSGTVIMLISVTVMPIAFDMLKNLPDDLPISAGPLTALTTILVTVGIALKSTSSLRLWAPIIGVAAGSIVSGYFGLYDTERVAAAAWIGLPTLAWPGINLEFGPVLGLLPAFLFVTLVGAVETVGDSIAIQRVSWRRPRAVDYRAVQGAVAADGMGNLLSGLMGTVPNTTYSTSVAMTELTGVASRRVGIVIGTAFLVIAFLPKALAVFLAIPDSVIAGFLIVLLSMLFVIGMKQVVQDGIDYRKGLVVGIGFWVGVGFQNDAIYPEFFSGFAGGLLQNGMTAGGLVAIIMTLFLEMSSSRRFRLEADFNLSSLPTIKAFLEAFASRNACDSEMANRLVAASEETLLTLLHRDEEEEHEQRRLLLVVHKEDGVVVIEFVAAAGEGNLQDRISLLGNESAVEATAEKEISLRLLRHYASSVHHQQYHDTDIVTIRVEAHGPEAVAGP